MDKCLNNKLRNAISDIKKVWAQIETKDRFIAFSGGKDSLALSLIIYEAIDEDPPPCLYVHHDMVLPIHLEYMFDLKRKSDLKIDILHPNLNYFDLIDRGIGFLTLQGSWCKQLLIGTGFLAWLQRKGIKSTKSVVMFRGISGSEYSKKWHSPFEIYTHLNMPCFNPLLNFKTEEIVELITNRYGVPLSPIYKLMERTYCICCYTGDSRSHNYFFQKYSMTIEKIQSQIKELLFDSNIIHKAKLYPEHKTIEEKFLRHGYNNWRRIKEQNVIGAVKIRKPSGLVIYKVKNPDWIDTQHLSAVVGKWLVKGDEVRFWDCDEKVTDILIKRMINCLNCGFCAVECLGHRRFDRTQKKLVVENCVQCGNCVRLNYCMGWQHRFWRRVIVKENI